MQIADGGGGAPSTGWMDSMQSFMKSADAIAGGAAAGKIAISETGGEALRQAVGNMAKWVDDNANDLERLADEPQLGSSQGAVVMKPYVASVASDDQGFIPMLMKFRESLEKIDQGIIDAMKNYRIMDQDGSGRLR